ncbi:hypothetical protein [Paenibacillus eucommiae]|uniref:Uncharacterized protein n=1 Tax=Paenibacillus eucommiae TaxID=1355755 RepID=A0ABS4IYL5_9BACL|nr:hypothetical protein [Paenibacillus eucommiae]MBP1992677.1 hypothetical protein [Paenibacillus eucommiae]
MKNIVKVLVVSAGGPFFIPSACDRWEISTNQEKNPCWLSVWLGVRAIAAKEREGVWEEER